MESLSIPGSSSVRTDPALEPNSPSTLYEQLSQSIRAAIHTREFGENERLPSEEELGRQYRVSRITVRRAIKDLVDEGILERRQGKGTFVVKPKVSLRAMSLDGFSQLTGSGESNARVRVVRKESREASRKEARLLNLQPGAPVYALTRLLTIDEEPIMLDTAVYDAGRFPGMLDLVGDNVSTYKIMSTVYGHENHAVEKEINITAARPGEAEALRCKVGDPLFYIEKVVRDQEGTVNHCSFDLLAASRVKLTMTYAR